MFNRRLAVPDRSFLLLGPRGTGKTTWLGQALAGAARFDLARDGELLRLMRDADRFRQEVTALAPGSWVVVDEIQRLPALLNEVQSLVADHPRRYRFALTGSSARKLTRGGANLLPGRLVHRRFFPLTADEMGLGFDVDDVLRFGTLPAVRDEPTAAVRIDLLDAYLEGYISQEIRLEALVRRLDSFVRFLEVAALANGQVTNVASLARDAGVARPTVQGYFDALVDTLVGCWVPAWRARVRVKEVAHPKFYFFDPGVVRALAGRLREPLERSERGPLLETYVLHELRAWQSHSSCGGEISYWRTPAGTEVDFIWTRAQAAVAIEVKASDRWRPGAGDAIKELVTAGAVRRAFAVTLGRAPLRDGPVEVLPLERFLARLYRGEVL